MLGFRSRRSGSRLADKSRRNKSIYSDRHVTDDGSRPRAVLRSLHNELHLEGREYRAPNDLPADGGPDFEGNLEHLSKLREGVDAWNAWREENPGVYPNLQNANLSGTYLESANLSGVNLWSVNLAGAYLEFANFSGADLEFANLSDAFLEFANFSGADLEFANFSGADLVFADFSGANLESANLSGAHLELASFSGAKLESADLRDANLRHATGLLVDNNPISGAQFSPNATDPWSVLRRAYTGPAFIVNVLLVALYFLPIVAAAAVLDGVSRAQQSVIEATEADGPLIMSEACPRAGGALEVPLGEATVMTISCYSQPIWQMLLGVGAAGVWGLIMPILTTFVVIYQLMRFSLTQRVSRMRDAEERSGITPPRKELGTVRKGLGRLTFLWPGTWTPRSYPKLYGVHRLITWALVPIVIIAFLLRGFEFVTTDIIRRGEPPAVWTLDEARDAVRRYLPDAPTN